ncbi:MAG: ABC transporter permease [Actinobacteria bacterium]|nr:ABC transporter permease [Actinomycetota bacterium]
MTQPEQSPGRAAHESRSRRSAEAHVHARIHASLLAGIDSQDARSAVAAFDAGNAQRPLFGVAVAPWPGLTDHHAAVASPTSDDRVPWRFAVLDTAALIKRDLLRLVREPGLLVFTFVQPVLFVLLFRYVFGGTLGRVIGMDYVNYLLPGIFVQAVALGAVSTAIGLAEDLGGGIIDRFRSLPMVRMSVLAARTFADLIRNVGIIVVMLIVGMLIGFRPHTVVGVAQAAVLVLVFAYALSWLMALVGLRSTSAEEAQSIAFPLLLPLTFASSAFVPVATMPGWLQFFAANQPVTIVVNACRGLMLGPEAAHALQASGSFTTDTTGYVLRSLIWTVGILVVAVPLAVRKFNET